jgi:hypothetical protein
MDWINETEMNGELRKSKIAALAEQITKIYKDRAEREQDVEEWEAQTQIKEQEKKIQEREEEAERAAGNKAAEKDAEEVQKINEQSDIRSFVRIAAQKESVRNLSGLRARMSMEATQLRHAIEFDFGFKQIGLDVTIKVPTGHENPNDFRNKQFSKLNLGIARIDTAVMSNVASMYRRSVQGDIIVPPNAPEEEEYAVNFRL